MFINGRKLTNNPLAFIAKKHNSQGMRIMQSAVNYNKAPFCVKVSLFITRPVVCSKCCAHTTFLCQRTQALLWPAHSSAETKPTAFIKLTQCPPTAPPRPSLASPQPHWESTRDISYSAKSCRVPRDVPIYCLSDVWRHKPQISTTWNCSLHKKTGFFSSEVWKSILVKLPVSS